MSRSLRIAARRVAFAVLTLWLVSIVVFAAFLVLPGDPAVTILGSSATPERLAALRAQLNLDEPVIAQYLHWLGGLVTGDFGISAAARQPVEEVLATRAANTGVLLAVSAVIAIPLSIFLGVWTAVRRDGVVDHLVSTLALVLAGLPEFVVAIGLVLVFATGLFHVFPAVSLLPPGTPAWEDPQTIVLPAMTLVIGVAPYISRIMRGSMIEVLESEYVTTARLKGLSERTVIWRHAVPNAIVPAVHVTAMQLAWMAGGVVIVEFVFQYPGIGTALVNAVEFRDLPVVQAVTMLAAGIYVGLNLLADLTTILVTPKLRTAAR